MFSNRGLKVTSDSLEGQCGGEGKPWSGHITEELRGSEGPKLAHGQPAALTQTQGPHRRAMTELLHSTDRNLRQLPFLLPTQQEPHGVLGPPCGTAGTLH